MSIRTESVLLGFQGPEAGLKGGRFPPLVEGVDEHGRAVFVIDVASYFVGLVSQDNGDGPEAGAA